MQYVRMYINNMEADVYTASDLVLALNDGEGIPETVAEFFDVNE